MTGDFTLGLTTQNAELHLDHVRVEGRLPAWLHGTLVRNGPAGFEFGEQTCRHWFDGLAMLHSFSFADGRVGYANRFLRSPAHAAAVQDGKMAYRNYAMDPCRSIFRRLLSLFWPEPFGHNAGTNVARIAGRYMAFTETPMPVEFDLATLDTLGIVDYDDRLPGLLSTAHPHYDYARRAHVNYTLTPGVLGKHTYRVYLLADGSLRRQCVAKVPVRRAAYMHSFGMTENYVILAQFPFFLQAVELAVGRRPFIENFRWQPEQGTRFTVIEKRSGKIAFERVGEPFFAFHHINAFEEGDSVQVDVSAYVDSRAIDELYLPRLLGENGGAISQGQFRRYRLSPSRDEAASEVICAEPIELPQMNYAHAGGKPYRYAYGTGVDPERPGDFLSRLVKVDTHLGAAQVWRQEGCYPGEPIFVAAPDPRAEDDGVVLSIVLDARRQTSSLLVLDAASFQELARAEIPQHIPITFHGKFFSDDGYQHSL